jgi:hypothetical protein
MNGAVTSNSPVILPALYGPLLDSGMLAIYVSTESWQLRGGPWCHLGRLAIALFDLNPVSYR